MLLGLCFGMAIWSETLSGQTPLLNELMASNDLAHFDDFFESDDWVEIYNPGGLLDLAGYHLSDDPDVLDKYTIPDSDPGSTFMTPNDHLVVWLDKDSVQGVLHANFKLSADNEGIWLTAPDGVTVLDSMVYPPQQTDISYGRMCDGCEGWMYFDVPTPEEENLDEALPTATLYLNEVLLDNGVVLVDEFTETNPWLEIYNPNPFQVHLGGYSLQTSTGSSYVIPPDLPVETTVESEGYLLLWLDGQPEQGGHHMGWLAEDVDQTIVLKGVDGVEADSYDVQTSFSNISWGRATDGAPNSIFFDVPTPRVTNSLFVVPPADLVINEFLAYNLTGLSDPQNEMEDWVEVHNLSDVSVDLSGYYVSDRLNNPTKWKVPSDAGDSTVVPAGGYVLLYADEDGDDGWNHMNFKLNNNGEVLVLRSPDGFSLADSVHFGASQADQSFARLPNGTGPFEPTTELTPGACNDCSDDVEDGISWDVSPWIVGPNPARQGQTITVQKDCTVYAASGEILGNWKQGSHGVKEEWSGLVLFVNHEGEVKRWVVNLDF